MFPKGEYFFTVPYTVARQKVLPLNVHLFVFDSFSDWEAAYAIAGINNPQFQIHPGRYRVRTFSPQGAPVVSIGGIRVLPDFSLEDLVPSDSALLLLPGGTAWDEGKNTEAVAMASAFLDAGVPVAGICGATAGLARGGLLDHRRHTSNAREYLADTRYKGLSLYEDSPAVTGDNVITASGIAPIDFAYHIFRRLAVYRPSVLEAWYRLFSTGRPEYFGELMQAVSE